MNDKFVTNQEVIWDLTEVSAEVFKEQVDQADHAECTMNTSDEDYIFQAVYTDALGKYIGTVAIDDDGTHYLIPEQDDEA